MPNKKDRSAYSKNVIVILVYFIAAMFSLNGLGTLAFRIIGVACIIAAVFGVVSLYKTGRFLF